MVEPVKETNTEDKQSNPKKQLEIESKKLDTLFKNAK